VASDGSLALTSFTGDFGHKRHGDAQRQFKWGLVFQYRIPITGDERFSRVQPLIPFAPPPPASKILSFEPSQPLDGPQ
jgi:hypothetical protein